jgi:hypothetical protein
MPEVTNQETNSPTTESRKVDHIRINLEEKRAIPAPDDRLREVSLHASCLTRT